MKGNQSDPTVRSEEVNKRKASSGALTPEVFSKLLIESQSYILLADDVE